MPILCIWWTWAPFLCKVVFLRHNSCIKMKLLNSVFEFKAEKIQPASREHNLKSPVARVILPWCRNMPVSATSECSLCSVASPVPFFSCLHETRCKPSLFQFDHYNAFTFVQVRDGGGGNIPAIVSTSSRERFWLPQWFCCPLIATSLSLSFLICYLAKLLVFTPHIGAVPRFGDLSTAITGALDIFGACFFPYPTVENYVPFSILLSCTLGFVWTL